ncbi:protein kinase [Nocardia sp. CA2R105]|uniref:protein kinase domain-containing protein n=1 Tax=Nocardia coffeae TaxID=2873381 RepID=UPI001CA71612|nr:protein kinase [Nocardia coffeae]MBY8856819.1 protein kinase [Nocardia coffeae]
MGEIDAHRTQRDAMSAVSAELADAGFADAYEIGSGGFGVVFRCTQIELDRTVAVKVLTADLEQDGKERFVREQRAMGRLTGHPNVVGVLQVGATASGLPYLVMPYYPQGSLDSRIRNDGPLSLRETLRVGVKLAGALETAHSLGILHRDVKPGNILITDYGEPALTDFGIARIADGFRTVTGVIEGSPAFTAPEVLSGEEPSPAADVYGLGATLFAALTGHAAFERRSGEQVVAQFLRITSQPVPNLRESGVDEDVSRVIETAMARVPGERPTMAAFGAELQRMQARRGWPVDEMAIQPGSDTGGQTGTPIPLKPPNSDHAPRLSAFGSGALRSGTLPLELTSFVDRRTEVTEVKNLLASFRLVTLTGIGGAGKTRLALRVAAGAQRDVADGVWLVSLGELRDGALLPAVIAAAVRLGLREQPVLEALIEYLAPRQLLLVLDNCEQIVDAAAQVAAALLTAGPRLRILATSRETLGVDGEAVLRVLPLSVPERDRHPSLRGAPRYDAVTLFVERAAVAVPGFVLTDDNVAAVTEICRRVEGLPLAIELAAARLRALSPQQILERLTDRFALLTRGSRNAPSRQQTLRWCIDWSYSLCTAAEQAAWTRLSVFAGSFELDAAQQVCRRDLDGEELLDVVSALVDKSILIREESESVVRFRMLGTLRDYGRDKLEDAGELVDLRRRHRDWCLELAEAAEADWSSPRQLDWIARLNREQPNVREALEFSLSDDEAGSDAGLSLVAALRLFWFARSQVAEARYWLDLALVGSAAVATGARAKALQGAAMAADIQGDSAAAAVWISEAQTLADRTEDVVVHAFTDFARGLHAIFSAEPQRAPAPLEAALAGFSAQGDIYGQVSTLLALGWAYELQEDSAAALPYDEKALAITESHDDSVNRESALWATAVARWHHGDRDHALDLLREALRLSRQQRDPLMVAPILEALAWLVDADGGAQRAAVLMGAAQTLSRAPGSSPVLLPQLAVHHDATERSARRALGPRRFQTEFHAGESMDIDAAIAFALEEQPLSPAPVARSSGELTKREREVADLVAEGLTNKAVASRLVISLRTAQGHVEHILAKLGFTSRTQIAAWVAEQRRSSS